MNKVNSVSLEAQISRFLLWNRITPHTTTGTTPAELWLGRIPQSRLDTLKPKLSTRVEMKQQSQKKNHDIHAKFREFAVGDAVFVRDFPDEEKWLSGTVSQISGPVSYHVT